MPTGPDRRAVARRVIRAKHVKSGGEVMKRRKDRPVRLDQWHVEKHKQSGKVGIVRSRFQFGNMPDTEDRWGEGGFLGANSDVVPSHDFEVEREGGPVRAGRPRP